MPRKKTKEEFIKEAIMVHGNKYDYSRVVYVNNNTKVEIVCYEHGSFWQLPRTHVNKSCGCPKCSKVYSDQSYFIENATRIHKGKYDYSKVNYIDCKTKICIICPEHGEYWTTPNSHISGCGCRKCDNKRKSNQRKYIYGIGINDYEGFIKESDEAYKTWFQMLRRCYNKEWKNEHPTYQDCTVCDEWLYFSNFKKWFDDPNNGYIKGYFLDKDVRVKGNKIYSPETCCFLPPKISSITTQSNALRGALPIGVSSCENKFRVRLSERNKLIHLGTFNTKEEAFLAYKQEKERHIKELAEEYYKKSEINKAAYEGLLSFKISIND
jgi:hypothetical protein